MKRIYWHRIVAFLAIALIALLLWEWLSPGKEIKKPNIAFLSSNSTTIIQLSPTSQTMSGIKVLEFKRSTKPEQYEVYGKVLLPQLLVEARNRFMTAKSQLQKVDAQFAASSKEYERLKKLNQHNDVSLKNLQMMEATFLSDQASVDSAQNALQSETDSIRLQWGHQIADWIMKGTQEYLGLTQLQNYLLQLTLPQGIPVALPPTNALVKIYGSSLQQAQFISKAPTTDVQIQGLSFYFLLANKNTLLPGMSIAAYLPSTKPIQGVVIPRASVIWWQGSPWVYVEIKPRQYQRVKINTQIPTRKGFLVQDLDPKQRIVIQGAQVLLSQEVLGPNTTSPQEDD